MADEPIQWGGEQIVNTQTDESQTQPKVVGLANGDSVVVWTDWSATGDGSSSCVKAQLYDRFGNKIGGDIVVNTITQERQWQPDVAAFGDGGFVVTWSSQSYPNGAGGFVLQGVAAQTFDASGAKVGGEIPVSVTLDSENSSVAALDSGGFAVTWTQYDANGWATIALQKFDATGQTVGGMVPVSTLNNAHESVPSIAALGNDSFVLVWQDSSMLADDPSGTAVRMKIYADNGTLLRDETLVNTETSGDQLNPAIISLGSGSFLVAWEDGSGQFSTSGTIVAQMFDQNGDKLGDDFRIPADMLEANDVNLTALPGGRFFATYTRFGATGDGGSGIFGQLFDADGTMIGGEVHINTITAGNQTMPAVAALADGRVVVTWSDASVPAPDTSGTAIRMQILDPRGGQIAGTSAGEILIGSTLDDTFDGRGGNDTCYGYDGSDTVSYKSAAAAVIVDLAKPAKNRGDALGDVFISIENLAGSDFNDQLTGNAGNNVLEGGLGADKLNGGAGIDTASYANATGGVTVSLLKPNSNTGEALGDKYTSIENLIGTAFNDILIASNKGGTVDGRDGNDFIVGGNKADVLIGGADDDIFAIKDKTGLGDTFQGGAGTDTLGVGGTKAVTLSGFNATVSSIEVWEGNGKHVIGSKLADIFDFSGLVQMTSLAYVDAGAGDDTLVGSAFADDLRGGKGNDTITGSAGDDTLAGGAGNDIFRFAVGFGHDIITDFAAGTALTDVIDVAGLFADFAAVLAAAQQVGTDTVITFDMDNALTLQKVMLTQLNANDFAL